MFSLSRLMMTILVLVCDLFLFNPAQATETGSPVVLELFTSQGCSSCPPADALMKELSANDPQLLPLSFHVHYWDNLGWKDTYSSAAYTDRQKGYAQALGESGIFTPQLIVEGKTSVVGSDAGAVKQAIANARQAPRVIDVSLIPDETGHGVIASMTAKNPGVTPPQVDVWEIHFDRYAKTQIGGGENGGRALESVNNVTSLTPLGKWQIADGKKTITLHDFSGDGVAIIVQAQEQGSILGAGSYIK